MKSDDVRVGWRDVIDNVIAGTDVLVERYNKPVAAVIRYEDYMALREELEELRATQRAKEALEEWRRDPSTGRPYSEIRAELVEAGVLDAEDDEV
jgi:PHD/YefM family antitoxin component YafN of YafNO toxin-antitoxin module